MWTSEGFVLDTLRHGCKSGHVVSIRIHSTNCTLTRETKGGTFFRHPLCRKKKINVIKNKFLLEALAESLGKLFYILRRCISRMLIIQKLLLISFALLKMSSIWPLYVKSYILFHIYLLHTLMNTSASKSR